jgi:hypothetical protein
VLSGQGSRKKAPALNASTWRISARFHSRRAVLAGIATIVVGFSVCSGVAKLQRPAKINVHPKLGLEKAFWLSEHRSAELGDASGPDRRGVSGGYGTTTETAPFFGGKTD